MGFNRIFCASVLSLAILAGCGGGGDGTAPAAGGGGGGGTTTSGQLTNSPIDGVPYSATPSGLTGTTMNGGMFNFQAGDTVTFNIAGLEIAVPGGTRITPQTIAEELADGDAAVQANILANLTMFFQTIDSDGNAENGSVTIPDDIEFANAADLLTSLEMAPADFRMAFQMAIDGAYPEGSEPMVVDSTEAMLRFYRNELQGNWRLVNAVDGEETIASNADYQVLLSFDVGNTNAATDGVVNSFVFSEFELSNTEPDFSFVGVGTTNYIVNGDTAELQFTSLPRSLIQGFTNSSSESDPFLFSSKVTLDGNQLVLTLVEQGTTIVATFERFNNVKGSLIGSWYEVLPQDTFDGAPTVIAAPAENGSVDFGDDVAAVFYYFLSNSRVMLSFTDLPASASENGEEANGIVVADYTLVNGRLTFTNVVLDSVSSDTAPDPAVANGDFVTVGTATLNDTKRILTEGDTSNEQETYEIYRILSLSERVGAFERAAPVEAVEAR